MQLGGGKVSFERFPQALEDFLDEDEDPFAEPELETDLLLDMGEGSGNHVAVTVTLYDAIQTGTPLMCDGVEGRMSLELANAMLLSSHGWGAPSPCP